ncbi:hypothetical protein EYF80_012630 [Liparis tanakae]|uniref:Uncharacterized protein n=1 Tax=Liparis tanakae TaxID=230148 RepID=A0A4Z2IHF4_9TELE|nr:hypothetical protein EYF80_012630 [Liparis tanakae]
MRGWAAGLIVRPIARPVENHCPRPVENHYPDQTSGEPLPQTGREPLHQTQTPGGEEVFVRSFVSHYPEGFNAPYFFCSKSPDGGREEEWEEYQQGHGIRPSQVQWTL